MINFLWPLGQSPTRPRRRQPAQGARPCQRQIVGGRSGRVWPRVQPHLPQKFRHPSENRDCDGRLHCWRAGRLAGVTRSRSSAITRAATRSASSPHAWAVAPSAGVADRSAGGAEGAGANSCRAQCACLAAVGPLYTCFSPGTRRNFLPQDCQQRGRWRLPSAGYCAAEGRQRGRPRRSAQCHRKRAIAEPLKV